MTHVSGNDLLIERLSSAIAKRANVERRYAELIVREAVGETPGEWLLASDDDTDQHSEATPCSTPGS